MKQWSKYYQNKEFLIKSRMQIMNQDMSKMVCDYIGIESHMKVLDVACGIGSLTFYLSKETENVNYTGVDLDEDFINEANEIKKNEYLYNNYKFVKGDATKLDFDDSSFDIIVSQTALTAISDYTAVVKEMIRVCKNNGVIASINPISTTNVHFDSGVYDRKIYKWKDRYDILNNKLTTMYQALAPITEMTTGIDAGRVPYFFHISGLNDIKVFPIGKFFSLSNATISNEEKIKFIENDYISEIKKMEAVSELDIDKEYMTLDEISEFKEVLKNRRDSLLQHLNDNFTWEWLGGCSLLVVAKNVK